MKMLTREAAGLVGQDGILRAGWQPAPGGHLQTSTGGLPTRRTQRVPLPTQCHSFFPVSHSLH